MPKVQMPDGKVVQFPDSMSKEDMQHASMVYVQKNIQPEPEEKTDWGRGVAQVTGSALGGLVAGIGGQLGPQVATPEELVTVPAAMAMGDAMGGQAYDYVRGLIYPETMPSMGEAAGRAATDMAVDVAGGKIAETAFKAGKTVFSPIKSAIKRKVGPVGAETARDVTSLHAQGFKPEVGMLDNPEARAFSQSMRGKPATGSIYGEVDAHNFARGQQVNQEIADELGPNLTPYEIGELMRRDALAMRNEWKGVNDELWKKVGDFVPDDAAIPAVNVIAKAQEILQTAKQSPYAADAMSKMAKQAELVLESVDGNGNISKTALDSIKKAARGAYKKLAHEADDVDRLRMAFERAADRDLGDAAEMLGGDAAKKARGNAKDWFKRGMGNKKDGDVGLLDEVAAILKNPEPEAIYRQLMRGGKPAADKLMRAMNMLSEETTSALRSRAYRDLGRPTPGRTGASGEGFSFATFLTRYARMQQEAPGASDILFGPAKKEMDKLLKNAEFFKSLDNYANSSQTAINTAWDELWKPIIGMVGTGAFLGGAGGMSIGGAIKGAGVGVALQGARLTVQRRVARLMTDPEFVKWLAGSTRTVAGGSASKPNVYGRLAAIALQRASSSEQRQKVDDIVWYLGATGHDVKRITDQNGKTKKVEVE